MKPERDRALIEDDLQEVSSRIRKRCETLADGGELVIGLSRLLMADADDLKRLAGELGAVL